MSVNRVILVGRAGQDPETAYAANGNAVVKFSLATSERWKDKQGQQQERTEWHRCVAFGRLAEIIGQYVRKGSQIYVEGSLQANKYTDKKGIERYSTDINVKEMQMLDSKRDSENNAPINNNATRDEIERQFSEDIDNDIPF